MFYKTEGKGEVNVYMYDNVWKHLFKGIFSMIPLYYIYFMYSKVVELKTASLFAENHFYIY